MPIRAYWKRIKGGFMSIGRISPAGYFPRTRKTTMYERANSSREVNNAKKIRELGNTYKRIQRETEYIKSTGIKPTKLPNYYGK
jgi:hypothetical protein